MPATGRCLCGAVTFVAHDVTHALHVCHCSMCRRWSGGPGFFADVGAVTFVGEADIGRYASSDWAERGFCKRCGTSLFYRLTGPDRYLLSTGAFDDQSAFHLHSEIYVDAKPPGYAFAGEHPRMTGEEFLATLR